jgi:selenocysteine-specific elongation factor
MIVGTAGHIDHGKTTLVRALTGVDTDRLPEEKRRGISIELGYAFMDAGPQSEPIGFIDVPGHERLVHTMLAGATGIDAALLLVAADDGPMPQTREHLAVLSLLGIARGLVVITKADRVPPERVAAVRQQVAALVAPTPLREAPVMVVSAATGQGVESLKDRLLTLAAAQADTRRDALAFRLAVDRVFTLAGVGTVVTGSVHAGCVRMGDVLVLRRVGGGALREVRVRGVHAQNREVLQAHAGQRCALALAGTAKDEVARGDWVCAPSVAAACSARIDVQLGVWHEEAQALRSGTPVHVHLGAASTLGSVAVLQAPAGGDALRAGEQGLVQLVLHTPLGAWHGDRVVLRDAAASRTLAGGMVLDPFAPTRYRRTPQRQAELQALALPDARARLRALLDVAPQGVDLRRFAVAQGLAPEALLAEPEAALRHHDALHDLALGSAHAAAARERVLQSLADFHAAHPDELGPDAARLRRLALPRWPEPLWRALLTQLLASHEVAQRGAFVHRPEHALRLSAADERIAQKIAPLLAQAGFEGAWARDLARDAREAEPLLRTTLARLAQRGDLHQVVKDLVVSQAALAELARIARTLAQAHGGEMSAAAFRDATHLGRKRAIQVLEYFDRIGLLRRHGDVHRLRADSALFREDM